MKLAIFDLGQVCVRTEYEKSYAKWEALAGMEPGSFARISLDVEEHFRYERGEIDCREFANWFCESFKLSLTFEQWSEGWNAMFTELVQPTVDTVRAMKEKGIYLAMLSNTNENHYEHWYSEFRSFTDLFDSVYLSHQMGMRKPDPAIFSTVLALESVDSDEVVFFDDRIENVMAARDLGIESVHFTSDATAWDWWREYAK